MNFTDLWPFVAASAGVVFCAGQLVEKIRNGKYVAKTECQGVQRLFGYRFDALGEDLKRIEGKIDRLNGGE